MGSNDPIDVVIPPGMEASYKQLHFAPAVREGDRLYCSGQVGNRGDGSYPDGAEAQFAQAFENVGAVLAAAGASFSDVLEMTTFHVDFGSSIMTFAGVKDRYMEEPFPAWTAVGVSELAFGALVEIKVVARAPR